MAKKNRHPRPPTKRPAPPAILSIFLCDELTEVIEAIATGKPMKSREKVMHVGADVLPGDFRQDE